MPLPWKKAGKATRISQLLTNHLHPPKRGGSLVLETGFPTSLADLFVKNCDRFSHDNITIDNNYKEKEKKTGKIPKHQRTKNSIPCKASPTKPRPSSRPKRSPGSGAGPGPSGMLPPSSNNLPTPSSMLPPSSPLRASITKNPHSPVCEITTCVGDHNDQLNLDCDCLRGKLVFAAIVKMFVVVILALEMKTFAVGISISAILLLLMEYAGRNWGRSMKAPLSLLFLMARVPCLLGLVPKRNDLVILEKDDDGDDNTNPGVKAPLDHPPLQEIPFHHNLTVMVSSFKSTSGFGPEFHVNSSSGLDSSSPSKSAGELVPGFRGVESISKFISSSSPSSYPRMKDLISEIHVTQPSSNWVPPIQDISRVKHEFSLHNNKEKFMSEEKEMGRRRMKVMVKKQEAAVHKNNRSDLFDCQTGTARKGRIRSKLKRFANKLNFTSKKKPKQSMLHASMLVGGDNKAKNIKNADEQRDVVVEFGDDSTSSLLSGRGLNLLDDHVNVQGAICLLEEDNEFCPMDEGEACERGRPRKNLSRYLTILVIILAGLMGGRLFALAFATSSWYLLREFGSRLTCITDALR